MQSGPCVHKRQRRETPCDRGATRRPSYLECHCESSPQVETAPPAALPSRLRAASSRAPEPTAPRPAPATSAGGGRATRRARSTQPAVRPLPRARIRCSSGHVHRDTLSAHPRVQPRARDSRRSTRRVPGSGARTHRVRVRSPDGAPPCGSRSPRRALSFRPVPGAPRAPGSRAITSRIRSQAGMSPPLAPPEELRRSSALRCRGEQAPIWRGCLRSSGVTGIVGHGCPSLVA